MQHSSGATASEAWAPGFLREPIRPLQEGLKPLGVTRTPASCQGRRDLAVQEPAEPWANHSPAMRCSRLAHGEQFSAQKNSIGDGGRWEECCRACRANVVVGREGAHGGAGHGAAAAGLLLQRPRSCSSLGRIGSSRPRHCMAALQAAFLAPLIDLGWIRLVTDWTGTRRAPSRIATSPSAG